MLNYCFWGRGGCVLAEVVDPCQEYSQHYKNYQTHYHKYYGKGGGGGMGDYIRGFCDEGCFLHLHKFLHKELAYAHSQVLINY